MTSLKKGCGHFEFHNQCPMPIVDCEINGHPKKLILDTGCAYCLVIHRTRFKELGIDIRNIRIKNNGKFDAIKPKVNIRFLWSPKSFIFNICANEETDRRLNNIITDEVIGVLGLDAFYGSVVNDAQLKDCEIIFPMTKKTWLFCHNSNIISKKCVCEKVLEPSFITSPKKV